MYSLISNKGSYETFLKFDINVTFFFRFFFVCECGPFFFIFLISFFLISWRLITLQYCSGFCHTLT